MEVNVKITGGCYKFAKNTVLVQKFPKHSLIRTTTTKLGGKWQEHFSGYIIKVKNEYIKEI